MDQEYDAVILGTGLGECLLAGLLSVDGMKVLHKDRNLYYGGESVSLNQAAWGAVPPANRAHEVRPVAGLSFDMVPKFMMGNGLLKGRWCTRACTSTSSSKPWTACTW